MTGDELAAWRQRLRLNVGQAAAALGCGRNSITRWESGAAEIPRYIALACAAIAQGLPPIGPAKSGDEGGET